jgi:hypothetical protein
VVHSYQPTDRVRIDVAADCMNSHFEPRVVVGAGAADVGDFEQYGRNQHVAAAVRMLVYSECTGFQHPGVGQHRHAACCTQAAVAADEPLKGVQNYQHLLQPGSPKAGRHR